MSSRINGTERRQKTASESALAYARRKLRRELADPARAIARWAASALRVPTGRLAGQPFKLESWQIEFLRGALGSAHSAALSLPRKLGKTSLIAIVLLAFLVTTGPLFRARFRGLVISRDGGLAAELKRHVGEIIAASGIEGVEIKRSPAPGRIVGPNGDVDILNADKSSGHAAGADVCVIDEAGLLEERHRPLWDAVNSARSGRDGRLIALGVRSTGPMFAELLARGAAGDPNVFAVDYSAPEDCDLNNESAWRKANPGLGSIKSIAYMRERSAEALAVPAAVAGFRLLDLNQKIAPRAEMLVRLDLARAAEVKHVEDLPPRVGRAFLGFDLGGSVSLTAACCMWSSGRVSSCSSPCLRSRRHLTGAGPMGGRSLCAGYGRWRGSPTRRSSNRRAGVRAARPEQRRAMTWLSELTGTGNTNCCRCSGASARHGPMLPGVVSGPVLMARRTFAVSKTRSGGASCAGEPTS